MDENYALSVLLREQQTLTADMQLQGPGQAAWYDYRVTRLQSIEDAISKLKSGK